MPNEFALYSTDISATVEPDQADPAPATLVQFTQDPIFPDQAEYDPDAGSKGRGSVIPTLGGIQIQDFATQISDGRIVLSDTDALEADVVSDIDALFEANDEIYFTDGFEVWKVRFQKPDGWKRRRNMLAAHAGVTRYSYEMTLIPTEKSI